MSDNAIVITGGLLDTISAKTAHGLIRGTERFTISAIIDQKHAGKDAGEVLELFQVGAAVTGKDERHLELAPVAMRRLHVARGDDSAVGRDVALRQATRLRLSAGEQRAHHRRAEDDRTLLHG